MRKYSDQSDVDPMMPANETKSAVGEFAFLAGGGEMSNRIRLYDWTTSPLGPISSWPQSLKTSISLMLNSQHPMWIGWGPGAAFLYNDAYISVLSLAKHPSALGKPAAEVWPEIWDICGPLADKVFQRGEASYLNDVRLFMSRGNFLEETFYSFSYSPIRDESGQVGGLFCPSADVTPKVLNTRRLRTLSELAAGSLLEKSTEGACASAASILSRNPDDLPFALLYLVEAGGSVARLEQSVGIPRELPAVSPALVSLADSPPPWPIAEVLQTAQSKSVTLPRGKEFPLGAAGQPVAEALVLPLVSRGQERPLGILVAGVNPTRPLDAEYRAFYDLIASHVASAIQNARATAEEKKRADLLAELDRAKTTFFSNISHELRTPLTLILGPLEDEMRENAVPRERLELAHRNSLRLLKLVNTLLDFSRIEAGRIEASFEPTDLAAYTEELASVFRSGMERAGLRFIVNCPPLSEPVYVDRDMWEKIVFNLLSNAFKFTAAGEIEIKLAEANHFSARDHHDGGPILDGAKTGEGRAICLQVRDTGTGIPAAEVPRVFERFHRVRNSWSRSHEGTGIGLALVQELTRQHGGQVTVESAEGRGSIFNLLIPLGRAHLPAERISAGRSLTSTNAGAQPYVEEALRWLPPLPDAALALDGENSGPRPLILLADDNSDMREYVRRLLFAHGCHVVAVANGRAALEVARQEKPALVLSDVMMPGLDGFELVQALRQDAETRTIPIILMSARAGEEARVEGLEAGADDYLTKPFSARELTARVRTHLELARIRREAGKVLADSERQLRAICDGIHEYTGLLTPEGTLLEVNRAALAFANSKREDVVGRPFWDGVWFQFTPGAPAVVKTAVARAAAGETVRFEAPLITPAGEWKTFEFSFDPVRDEQGKVTSIVPGGRDITGRKRRERNLAFLAEVQKILASGLSATSLMKQVAEKVAGQLGLAHCLLVEINQSANTATVLHDHYVPGNPDLTGVYPISEFHSPEEQQEMAAGKTIAIEDTRHDPRLRAQADRFARLGIGALVNASYTSGGVWKFMLCALGAEPRRWQPDEIELLGELAARIYIRLERARAEERLRESEERFRSVFEHAATGIVTSALTGRIERCNPAYCALLGYTEEELTKLDGAALLHPADREQNLAEVRRLHAGKSPYFEIENRLIRKSGQELWVHEFVSLLRDQSGKPAHQVSLVTDVSERRRNEAALKEAKEAAETANSAKDRFLAVLSHELRTPLTPVLMTAATLQEDARLPRDVRDQLGMMERNISLEARLIDDLLDITAISRGKFRLRPQACDAHSLINLALEIVRDEALTKEISIVRDFAAQHSGLQADPARFQQVIWNLLRNAVKFTARGGRISLRTAETIAADGLRWLRVEVTDSGIGIEPSLLEKIFHPFEQGAVTGDHRFGGMGLGLAIARAIMDLHGGRISAHSDGPGHGATFIVEMPGATAVPHGVANAPDAAPPRAKVPLDGKAAGRVRRLLLVEDHAATLQVISILLGRSGYEIVTATNVAEALAAAASDQFDLVISDLGLPDGTGVQLMEQLRAQHGLRGIALTGYGMDSDVARARDAGFVAHLVKPVHIAELRRILATLG